ncbi:ABC transporter substrate-binding protein [Motiliproteus sp. MSK22-1]|uniref:substrate-binding periplasmic protein n=1 Tax=Motiliproteus sp. MSK22-1 TaxID=1897630 RepID=UPI000977E6DB|nr:transporter substrate-binding domain-containing protein [Motiliproteus sp. MSK22-1]OMH33981.1 hypothetical protein BGP75_13540 [Motiliproteus sp. MSK22-1]
MSVTKRLGLTLTTTILFPAFAWGACTEVTLGGHPDFPPVIWAEAGQVRGIGADVAQLLLDKLGVPVRHSTGYPYKRVQRMLALGELDMVGVMARNREREAYSIFIEPPYAFAEAVVWSRSEDPRQFDKLESLSGLFGALRVGTTYGQHYDEFFATDTVTRVHDINTAFKMLLNGRIDYVVYDRLRSQLLIQQQSWQGKLKHGSGALKRNPLYLALSQNSPCAELAPVLEKGMKELLDTGRIAEITAKHLRSAKGTDK